MKPRFKLIIFFFLFVSFTGLVGYLSVDIEDTTATRAEVWDFPQELPNERKQLVRLDPSVFGPHVELGKLEDNKTDNTSIHQLSDDSARIEGTIITLNGFISNYDTERAIILLNDTEVLQVESAEEFRPGFTLQITGTDSVTVFKDETETVKLKLRIFSELKKAH